MTSPQEKVEKNIYWQTLEKVERSGNDDEGGEWVKITFVEGGTVSILTYSPLVWVAPREH